MSVSNFNMPRYDYSAHEKVFIDIEAKSMSVVPLDNILYCYRYTRSYRKPERFHQSYAHFWTLLHFQNMPRKSFFGRFNSNIQELYGSFFIFVPALACVEWFFNPGHYKYVAYASYVETDDRFPTYPIIFPDQGQTIKGYSCIVDILQKNLGSDLSSRKRGCYVAEKTKFFLDRFFTEDILFEDIAKEINLPRSSMTRQFSHYFGLAPVAYRNILRTFEAYRFIRLGDDVTCAGIKAGFTGKTQYNQHFHNVFDTPPSSFS